MTVHYSRSLGEGVRLCWLAKLQLEIVLHMISQIEKFLVVIVFASLFCSSVVSEENQENMIVTASRVPIEQHKLGKSVTVLDGEQLKVSQERYVADALRKVPGLAVSRSGSFGGLTQVRVRGAEGNHVLVLVDGVEISSASDGEYDLSGLQVANIERIEVLRGPQSAFWGSNATSGVINIITKKGVPNQHQVSIDSEAGNDGTRQAALAFNGGTDSFNYSLSGAFRQTDGFNISDFGSEDDGDTNRSVNGKFNIDLAEGVALNVTGRKVVRDSESDKQDFTFGSPTQGLVLDSDNRTSTEEQSVSLGLTVNTGAVVQNVRLEKNNNDRESVNDDATRSGNDSSRNKATYQLSYRFDTTNTEQSVTAGVEYEKEKYKNTFPSTSSQSESRDRELRGYVLQYSGEFSEQLFLTSAIRLDDNDKFENATTYSVSAAFVFFDQGPRLHTSIGTGVTNPTFFEQFGYFPDSFVGNEDLEPEENFGWELGIEIPFFDQQMVVDVTYFNEKLKNEIKTNYPPPTYIGTPVNLNEKSRREGVELSLTGTLTDDLSVNASYTYLETTEETDDGDEDEVRRPRNSGALNLTYNTYAGRGSVFLDAVYQGAMEDFEFIIATPETRVELDRYWTVKIGTNFRVSDTVEVYGRIENLLDKEYEEIFGFNTQGRTSFIGVRVSL